MEFKCEVINCSNIERKADTVKCNGLCQKKFHGACIGLERNWQASRLLDNFVCDNCINISDILRSINNENLQQILEIKDEQSVLINKTLKSIEANTEMLANIFQRLDEFEAPSSKYSNNNMPVSSIDALSSKLSNTSELCNRLENQLRAHSVSLTTFIKQKHLLNDRQADTLLYNIPSMASNLKNTAINNKFTQTESLVERIEASSVYKFGTHWSESDWEQRIKRLGSKNSPKKLKSPTKSSVIAYDMSLHCKCPPFLLNEKKMVNFMKNNFGISDLVVKEVTPKFLNPRQIRNSSFKIDLHRSVGSKLLSADANRTWRKFNMLVYEWKDNKGRIKGNGNSNNFSKSKISNNSKLSKNFNTYSNYSRVPPNNTYKNKRKTNNQIKKKNKSLFDYTPAIKSKTTINPLFARRNLNSNISSMKLNTNTSTKTLDNNFTLHTSPNLTPTSPTKFLRYPNFVQGESFVPNVSFPLSSPLRTYASTLKLQVQPTDQDLPVQKATMVEENESEVQTVSPIKSVQIKDAGKSNNSSFVNPLLPPIVRHTQNALNNTESLYDLSRLREKSVYENVRLYLAYLHDNPSACINGKTKMNVSVLILAEGLPNSLNELRNLFFKFHESLGMSQKDVLEELATYRSHIRSERTSYLQKIRENENKWFRPLK